MNKHLKPYIISLIKENLTYISILFVILFLLMVSVSVLLSKYSFNSIKENDLVKEVADLNKRVETASSAMADSQNLQQNIKLLDKLIPGTEDFFSIIYALENLSRKSGFQITAYSVDMKNSKVNKLQISISGSGDNESFIKFLKDYNFGGGRLITSDNIELSPKQSGNIKIDLAFYSKKTEVANGTLNFNKNLLDELTKLKQKVDLSYVEASEEASVDLSYPKNTSPF